MNAIVNLELLSEPLNWVIVFLILYSAVLALKFVVQSLGAVNINL